MLYGGGQGKAIHAAGTHIRRAAQPDRARRPSRSRHLVPTSTSPAVSLPASWEQATALSGLLERLGGRRISDSTPRDGRRIYSCSPRGCPGAPEDAVLRGSNEPDRRGLFQVRRVGARLSRALGVAGFSADPATVGRAGHQDRMFIHRRSCRERAHLPHIARPSRSVGLASVMVLRAVLLGRGYRRGAGRRAAGTGQPCAGLGPPRRRGASRPR